jgi:uncharacterized RDD family membrane protein YckC
VEGALAPKPEPLRELPGARKKEKEKSWRDEVNERVRSRRKRRESETGLPLFDQPVPEDAAPKDEAASASGPSVLDAPQPSSRLEETEIKGSVEEPVADLPLRGGDVPIEVRLDRSSHTRPFPPPADTTTRDFELGDEGPEAAPEPVADVSPEREDRIVRERESPLEERREEPLDDQWPLELEGPAPESRPVERPALFSERLQAAAVDLGLFIGLSAIVVYFTGRAARVEMRGLLPAWPWLAAYLVFLGVSYSAYFTGTTGQTLGKMLLGLRVVDSTGQPPGYVRAFLRAIAAALGVLAAGLGLVPVAFDPARRALHDRVFRTRVIRG